MTTKLNIIPLTKKTKDLNKFQQQKHNDNPKAKTNHLKNFSNQNTV